MKTKRVTIGRLRISLNYYWRAYSAFTGVGIAIDWVHKEAQL